MSSEQHHALSVCAGGDDVLRTSMNGVDLALTGNCVTAAVDGVNEGALMRIGRDNDDTVSFSGSLNINVETSGTEGGTAHYDIVQGPGPWWAVKSVVRATGSINLIPFSGTNFREGTANPYSFLFAGLLRKSPSLGSSPSFQPLQLYSQAVGRYGKDPSKAVQMIYIREGTAGTFLLEYDGDWLDTPLSYAPSVAAVQAALSSIPALGTNVIVTKAQARFINGYYADEIGFGVTFVDDLEGMPVETIGVNDSGLTGNVDVVVRNTGSTNYTINVEVPSGNIIKIEDVPGTYRLALNIGTLTDQVGVDKDSPFGLSAIDLWFKQPTTGGNVILEGPWFAGRAQSGSTYDFQWMDGLDPVLSTTPDYWDIIRLSTYNYNVWVGQHVTRKAVVDVPSTSTSPGVKGQRASDGSYEYVCVATNTWKRMAISSW